MKKLLIGFLALGSSSALAECTYRFDNRLTEITFADSDAETFLANEKGYILDPLSRNVLSIKFEKSRPDFPLINVEHINDTLSLGMTIRKSTYILTLSSNDKKQQVIYSSKFSSKYFGDKYSMSQEDIGGYRARNSKSLLNSLKNLKPCEH